MNRLSEAKIFIKLNIRQEFHRIRMKEDSESLIIFRTRYELFKFRVTLFELINDSAIFQRFVNFTFFDYLDKFLTAFIDDLLIYSKNLKKHKKHVKLVLTRLRDAELQVSISKCEFHVTRIKYLEFIVSIEEVKVDLEKIQIILN